MKKLGLIGGVGPESSIEYYRLIIKKFQERANSDNYPEFIIHSINMTEMLSYVSSGQLEKLIDFLTDRIRVMEQAGVDFGAIASNTPHLVFDELAKRVNIPLVSIVEETCKEMANKKMTRVGLLGTRSTMSRGFYNNVAKNFGIEIIAPETNDQYFVSDKYMNELIYNKIVPKTKHQFVSIVNRLIAGERIEGVILGGTELPLILSQSDFNNIHVFDTTQIHVESIVSKMLDS